MTTLLIAAVLAVTPDVSLYAPTPIEAVEVMLQLAEVTADDILYDLGCGEGWILVAASAMTGCRSVGIEINPQHAVVARRNVVANDVAELSRIYVGDVLKKDFRQATVVTCYLMEDLLGKLKPQFAKLKPGTRIVCYDKAIPGTKPVKQVKVPESENVVYLYKVPLVPIKCAGST